MKLIEAIIIGILTGVLAFHATIMKDLTERVTKLEAIYEISPRSP